MAFLALPLFSYLILIFQLTGLSLGSKAGVQIQEMTMVPRNDDGSRSCVITLTPNTSEFAETN